MNRLWLLIALAALSVCTLPAKAQNAAAALPASDANAWGDPVDGVQLHLAASKNGPPQLPGDLPRLEMQIRNMGTSTVTLSCHIGQMSEIEIDGTWHEPGGFFETGTCAPPQGLVPGNQSATIFLAFQLLLVDGKSVVFDGFHVGPGKHVVRVRTPSKSFGVEDSAHQVITLASNAITVDVPDAPTAQEQALADAISKMKSILAGLPANVPELVVANVAPYKNTVMAFYNPASNPNEAHEPPGVPIYAVPASQRVPWFLEITISSYDSQDEAQHGLELSERLTQVSPTQKQDLNRVTIYKWDQWGTYRVLFRVATSVVNIETSRPEAKPIADKVFQSLRQVLGTN